MIAQSIYYISLSVACLSLCIYNLNISEESKSLKCYKITKMDNKTYQSYVKSLQNKTENFTDAEEYFNLNIDLNFFSDDKNEVLFEVPMEHENYYRALQKSIGAIYITMSILCLILSFCINYMANMVPEDFMKMSKFKSCFGLLAKVLPILNILLHWVIFVLILVVWGFVGANTCEKSMSTEAGVLVQPYEYFNDTWILNTVTSAFWILIHYFGSLLKEAFYKEPFMYSDTKAKFAWFRFLSTKLGP